MNIRDCRTVFVRHFVSANKAYDDTCNARDSALADSMSDEHRASIKALFSELVDEVCYSSDTAAYDMICGFMLDEVFEVSIGGSWRRSIQLHKMCPPTIKVWNSSRATVINGDPGEPETFTVVYDTYGRSISFNVEGFGMVKIAIPLLSDGSRSPEVGAHAIVTAEAFT